MAHINIDDDLWVLFLNQSNTRRISASARIREFIKSELEDEVQE